MLRELLPAGMAARLNSAPEELCAPKHPSRVAFEAMSPLTPGNCLAPALGRRARVEGARVAGARLGASGGVADGAEDGAAAVALPGRAAERLATRAETAARAPWRAAIAAARALKRAVQEARGRMGEVRNDPICGTAGHQTPEVRNDPISGTGSQTQGPRNDPMGGTAGRQTPEVRNDAISGTGSQTQGPRNDPIGGTAGRQTPEVRNDPIGGTAGHQTPEVRNDPISGTGSQTQGPRNDPIGDTAGRQTPEVRNDPISGAGSQTQGPRNDPMCGTARHQTSEVRNDPIGGSAAGVRAAGALPGTRVGVLAERRAGETTEWAPGSPGLREALARELEKRRLRPEAGVPRNDPICGNTAGARPSGPVRPAGLHRRSSAFIGGENCLPSSRASTRALALGSTQLARTCGIRAWPRCLPHGSGRWWWRAGGGRRWRRRGSQRCQQVGGAQRPYTRPVMLEPDRWAEQVGSAIR